MQHNPEMTCKGSEIMVNIEKYFDILSVQ